MKNNKSLSGIIVILAITVVLLLLNTCRLTKRQANDNDQITALQLENQKLDSLTNAQGETIFTQESIITGSTDALDALTDSIFQLKKKDEKNTQTIAYYKASNAINLTGVNVPYLDSVAMKEFSDSVKRNCQEVLAYMKDSTVTVGMVAADSTANYTIQQTIQKGGITVDKLSIPDTLQLRFIERKNGLFRPKTVEVQFFHSNPLVTTTQANSVFYRPKKKSFLTRVVLPVAIGVGAGILISK